eukprot:7534210-Lingulodinium_polyedra.AAC.1
MHLHGRCSACCSAAASNAGRASACTNTATASFQCWGPQTSTGPSLPRAASLSAAAAASP